MFDVFGSTSTHLIVNLFAIIEKFVAAHVKAVDNISSPCFNPGHCPTATDFFSKCKASCMRRSSRIQSERKRISQVLSEFFLEFFEFWALQSFCGFFSGLGRDRKTLNNWIWISFSLLAEEEDIAVWILLENVQEITVCALLLLHIKYYDICNFFRAYEVDTIVHINKHEVVL